MNHLLIVATVTLALATILSLYRVFRGPTVFDRLTGRGLSGTKTVEILVLRGFLTKRLDMFVDISLAYGLIGFIGALVLAKYFEQKEAEQP